MASASGMTIPEETIKKIDLSNEALLFYTEHTTGYSESVREPLSLPTMEQRALKESYAWEANRHTASLGEDVMGLLQNNFRRDKDPSLLVFNTLNWTRSGPLTIYIDHQIVPRGMRAGIFDNSGNRCPAHVSNGFSTRFGWGARVPFLTRILPGNGTGNDNWEGSYITGWPSNMILISSTPSGNRKSILIHVRETDGKETSLNLYNGLTEKSLTAAETDVTGRISGNNSNRIKPLESKFFLLDIEK